MNGLAKLTVALGAVLALAGGTAVAAGVYQDATYDCTSGNALSVHPFDGDDAGASVAFENLSTEEQQLFLEALVDEHNVSRTDGDWSPELFRAVEVVDYRGNLYRTTEVEIDCAPPFAPQLKMGGVAVVVLGVGLLVSMGVRHRFGQGLRE